MQRVDECVICGGQLIDKKPASIAPFLLDRIWGNTSNTPVTLDYCGDCNFAFFNPRLEPKEEAMLYRDYRSPEYQRLRQKYEPWYTETANRELGFFETRFVNQAAHVYSQIHDRPIQSVLDFGGDAGQLAGRLPIPDKYVYDISGVPPVDGVIALRDRRACESHRYDLIICSHVLEHVAFPGCIMREIASLSASGTLVYVEVPDERSVSPGNRGRILTRAAFAAARCLLHPRRLISLMRPGVFRTMHEHVNSFDESSLAVMVARAGFRQIAAGRYWPSGPKAFPALWCLAAR